MYNKLITIDFLKFSTQSLAFLTLIIKISDINDFQHTHVLLISLSITQRTFCFTEKM